MPEKSILAYFKSPEEAEGASRKLQALRVTDLSIDRFTRYGGGFTSHARTGGPFSGLGSDADVHMPNTGVLAAADPSASGMSHGGDGGPTGLDVVLAVVLEEGSFERAVKIIGEAGGLM